MWYRTHARIGKARPFPAKSDGSYSGAAVLDVPGHEGRVVETGRSGVLGATKQLGDPAQGEAVDTEDPVIAVIALVQAKDSPVRAEDLRFGTVLFGGSHRGYGCAGGGMCQRRPKSEQESTPEN